MLQQTQPDVTPGRVPHINMFEQDSSDILPDVTSKGCSKIPMSDVQGGSGSIYRKVQCIMDNGHMGPPVDRMTDKHD